MPAELTGMPGRIQADFPNYASLPGGAGAGRWKKGNKPLSCKGDFPAVQALLAALSNLAACGLRGPYGYKWPTLSELHFKLFQTKFSEAQNAAADIAATAKCFWELNRLGVITSIAAL